MCAMGLEGFVYTDEILTLADEWVRDKKGTLRDFAEKHGFSYDGFLATRYQRRSGKRNGRLIREYLEWQIRQPEILRMIRNGVSVADIAHKYGLKKAAMHNRLVRWGLTPDIRQEMARGEWDEE